MLRNRKRVFKYAIPLSSEGLPEKYANIVKETVKERKKCMLYKLKTKIKRITMIKQKTGVENESVKKTMKQKRPDRKRHVVG